MNLNNFRTSINTLMSALRPMTYGNGAPKARNESGKNKYSNMRGATRRGAKHIVNSTFKSRNLVGVKPAQYRHLHMGKAK